TLNGGTSYKILLRDVYPALRHSDYAVKYTIRNFTVEEAKELLYTDPKQLSLSEMFQVAQTYEPGSRQYNEVFEIAVRMYPDDPVSNLNAANTAIGNKQLEQAKRYLSKSVDSPEKQLAEASIAMLEGDLDRAEQLLNPLKGKSGVSEAVDRNLEQIRLKREE
ncbi:type IV pilus biogenesis/stability protein PilW, partial [uncultured Parabacteroides sp.]|uniref:tetratricopeptide repeat protein n=1 Tax=uncultured Parabacteroides sp. TaxID=512312 RepID=UPI0035A64DDD